MILKRLKVNSGYSDLTNCYIVQDEDTKETMVIDPGGQPEKIIEMLDILNAKLKYIYLTHCHADHIAGVHYLQEKLGGKVLVHRKDAENLHNDSVNLASYIGIDKISTSLYCEEEKLLFSGDTLFRGTWGRTDLPTSNFVDIMESITKKLIILPENTIVYPGHGKSTMIKEEKPIYLDLKPRVDY